jgi:8-oxo-dGTP diphosphatase
MKNVYSRIQIPKEMQRGDISELLIVRHQDLAEFEGLYKIDESFRPVNLKAPRVAGIIGLQEAYVNQAMGHQANLVLVDGRSVAYMRCQERKRAGSEYPGVGVGAVILNQKGEIYLQQRGPLCGNNVGQWENPGGTQEFGQSLLETAERETLEESGLYVKAMGIISVSEEFKEGQHWTNFGILCQWHGKRKKDFVPEKGKVDGERWVDPEKLPSPMSKGAEAVILDYLTGVQIPINRVNR